jgi:hypothetical protein
MGSTGAKAAVEPIFAVFATENERLATDRSFIPGRDYRKTG